MRQVLAIAIVSIMTMTAANGQAGMRLYGGLSAMTNESAILDPSGPSVGYHAGADLRLNDGDMFFLLGGRFTNVGFTTNDDIYVTDKPSLQMINTRIGLGFKLFHLTNFVTIRAKLLGSIDYVFNTPLTRDNTAAGFEAFRAVNSTASAVGGLGVSLGSITIDLEYGYGLFNMISQNKETKPTHLSLSAGFFF